MAMQTYSFRNYGSYSVNPATLKQGRGHQYTDVAKKGRYTQRLEIYRDAAGRISNVNLKKYDTRKGVIVGTYAKQIYSGGQLRYQDVYASRGKKTRYAEATGASEVRGRQKTLERRQKEFAQKVSLAKQLAKAREIKSRKKLQEIKTKERKIGVSPKVSKVKVVQEKFKVGKKTRLSLIKAKDNKERFAIMDKIRTAFANGNLAEKNLRAATSQRIISAKLLKLADVLAEEQAVRAKIKSGKQFKDYLFRTKKQVMTDFLMSKIQPLKTYGSITIKGETVKPRTPNELLFYKNLKKVIERDERFKRDFSNTMKAAGLNIKDMDKWYTKALKGAGALGVGLIFSGQFLGNAIDKAIISGHALFTSKNIRQAAVQESKRATVVAATETVKSLDIRKPENWANIALLASGLMFAKYGGFFKFIARKGRKYRQVVRDVGAMRENVKVRLKNINTAKKMARDNIKARKSSAFSKRLLKKLEAAEKALKKSDITLKKIQQDPKVLKINDFNPLVESQKLLNQIGKTKTLYHVTDRPISSVFGQEAAAKLPLKKVIESVKKASAKPKRNLIAKTKLEKEVLKIAQKVDGVITGGRAQNVFVKKLLTRISEDFDILVKNPSKAAKEALKILKKKFPKNKFKINKFKSRGGFTVHRIEIDGKALIDFDPINKAKGILPVKAGKNKVANIEYLAEQKYETIFDPQAAHRQAKDITDLRRMVGDIFSNKKFLKNIKDPRNMFKVRPSGGVGADRLRFGEYHFYFDVEVATGYAYQSLIKHVFPKSLRNLVQKIPQKVPLRNLIIKALNKQKYIKANPRFTVFELKTKISSFPKELAARMKLAAKKQLTQKQAIKLRNDINKYINKNPNKVFAPPRGLAYGFGERENVVALNTLIKRGPKYTKQYSIDPATNVYFDVMKISLPKGKQIKPTIRQIIKKAIKDFKKDPLRVIRRKFYPEDAAKLRRLQARIKKADKLTDPAYLDFLEVSNRMLKSKTAKKVISQEIKKVKNQLKTKKRRVSKRIKTGVTEKGELIKAAATRKTSQTKRRVVTKKRTTQIKRVTPTRRVATRKTITRRVTPKRKATRERVTKRQPTRRTPTRGRTTTRTTIRPTTRTRQETRVHPRKRVTTRQRTTPRQRKILRNYVRRLKERIRNLIKLKKKLTKTDQEELKKWIKKQPMIYQPSLDAILYNIIGKKPKTITGLELRPILKKLK